VKLGPRYLRVLGTVAAMLPGAFVLGAQQEHTSTITVNARIVVLDVVVTDKKGNMVQRELGRDDFKVYEGGVQQKILSFETPSRHRLPAAAVSGGAVVNSAADLPKIGDAPVTILVLDELNSQFQDMSFSRQMMVKYLESQPAVLRQPTALMIAANTTFQQVHDYTQNRDELIEVVKKHMPEYPWRMENSGSKGAGVVERMAQVLAALQQLAQANMGTPGRKNLIWVGNGFPSPNVVGLPPDEAETIETAVRRCLDRLLAARVTVYTINPTADSSSTVEVDSPEDLDQSVTDAGPDPFGSGQLSFSNLAPATGGVAFTGRNDLQNIIGESIDKGQEYYTLSYTPTDKSENSVVFRGIKIVMADPNLRATTRDGYYPETEGDLNPVVDKTMDAQQKAKNLELDLSAALTTTISYNGLDVTATKSGPGDYTIHVAEKGLEWSEPDANGTQQAEATIAAGWYDSKGKLLGHIAREETYPRGATNAGATFHVQVALPGNQVRLRIVARDARNGHMGTVDVVKF